MPLELIHRVWRIVLAWLDRRTDPPIMRQHINAGSEKYFTYAEQHQGDSELDDLLAPTVDLDGDAVTPRALARREQPGT